MPQDAATKGYLIIADISGYTSLLTTTEIDHASDIVKSLLSTIYRNINRPFSFVKYEGDAILYYIESDTVEEGEKIIEHVEAVYNDFHSQLNIMDLNTTCTCKACSNINRLNLKFFVHYGEFLKQKLPGAGIDIAGFHVIVLHRLLKNKVYERFQSKGYALISHVCLPEDSVPAHAQPYEEHYEDVGILKCHFINLEEQRTRKLAEERKYFEAGESDFVHEDVFPYSPEVLWNYCIYGDLRLQWQGNTHAVNNIKNKQNRIGVGSEVHCVHSGYKRKSLVIDSRPFHYFIVISNHTPAFFIPPMKVQYTMLRINKNETKLSIRVALLRRNWFTLKLAKPFIEKFLKMEMNYKKLHQALNERMKDD